MATILSWGSSQFPPSSISQAGREVEDFAECLDRLYPRRDHDPETVYENAFKLVRSYQTIAENTVKRLRKEHAPKRQRLLSERWRRRVQEINEEVSEDPDFEEDEDDEPGLSNTTKPTTTMEDLRRWEQEAQTWDLLALMLDLQYARPGIDREKEKNDNIRSIGEITQYSSEEKIWEQFLVKDDLAKERHAVLSWLKRNAESSGTDIDIMVRQLEEGAERGKGLWAHGWLYTKEAVKAQKRLRAWPQVLDPSSPSIAKVHLNSSKNQQLVTQLDPDAATRQSRVLENQDEYFERAIWLACWEMLRRGKSWGQVREWCRERVEGWRSVSMRGNQPAWDSFIDKIDGDLERGMESPDESDGTSGAKISGNRSRALWRRMCFALARRGGVDDYERAVYGILCGDLPSVQKVCRTWDDLLFAHYNSLVLSQFDRYLLTKYPDRIPPTLSRKFGLFDSIQFHGEPQHVSHRLVDSLNVHPISKQEAKQTLKKIQGSFISRRFPEFVYQQGIAISKLANDGQRSKIIPLLRDTVPPNQSPLGMSAQEQICYDDIDALRVMVHALLIFQQLGLDILESPELVAAENIIVAYIQFLSSADKLDLVPLYASRLSKLRSELTLGRIMLGVTEHSERGRMVKLMQGLNINVEEVVKTQMGLLLTDLSREEDDKDTAKGERVENDIGSPEQIVILEYSADPHQMGRQVRLDFIADDLSQVEDMLISSLEWFLAVEGMWFETFHTGTRLYKRFLRKSILGLQLCVFTRS
jgi:nuclear pore complex protein Nup107